MDSLDRLAEFNRLAKPLSRTSHSPPTRTVTAPKPIQEKQKRVPLKPSIFNPKTFDDYIGQDNPKKLMSIMVQAAKQEHRSLPNILITGGFGLGKTSLAMVAFREFKGEVYATDLKDGMTINKEKPESGMLIIDEIHLVDPGVADRLNVAIDAGKLSIVGCTTDPGKLPSAFKSRFRTLELERYSISNIEKIAENICTRKGVIPSPGVLNLVAQRSRSNARQVTVYLSMIFDLMAVNRQRIIDPPVVYEAFNLLGVDAKGFTERDRKYVDALPNRPIGISALTAVLGIDQMTIENEIEPYLLQMGIIDRTPRGRIKLRPI